MGRYALMGSSLNCIKTRHYD